MSRILRFAWVAVVMLAALTIAAAVMDDPITDKPIPAQGNERPELVKFGLARSSMHGPIELPSPIRRGYQPFSAGTGGQSAVKVATAASGAIAAPRGGGSIGRVQMTEIGIRNLIRKLG